MNYIIIETIVKILKVWIKGQIGRQKRFTKANSEKKDEEPSLMSSLGLLRSNLES